MTEEDHYVKVKVDGDVVADSDLCGGDPTSFKCTFKVTHFFANIKIFISFFDCINQYFYSRFKYGQKLIC
jgi:hypothetical protein